MRTQTTNIVYRRAIGTSVQRDHLDATQTKPVAKVRDFVAFLANPGHLPHAAHRNSESYYRERDDELAIFCKQFKVNIARPLTRQDLTRVKPKDTQGWEGATPLHIAARYRSASVLKRLLLATADVKGAINQRDASGRTVLEWAEMRHAGKRKDAVVQLLEKWGADHARSAPAAKQTPRVIRPNALNYPKGTRLQAMRDFLEHTSRGDPSISFTQSSIPQAVSLTGMTAGLQHETSPQETKRVSAQAMPSKTAEGIPARERLRPITPKLTVPELNIELICCQTIKDTVSEERVFKLSQENVEQSRDLTILRHADLKRAAYMAESNAQRSTFSTGSDNKNPKLETLHANNREWFTAMKNFRDERLQVLRSTVPDKPGIGQSQGSPSNSGKLVKKSFGFTTNEDSVFVSTEQGLIDCQAPLSRPNLHDKTPDSEPISDDSNQCRAGSHRIEHVPLERRSTRLGVLRRAYTRMLSHRQPIGQGIRQTTTQEPDSKLGRAMSRIVGFREHPVQQSLRAYQKNETLTHKLAEVLQAIGSDFSLSANQADNVGHLVEDIYTAYKQHGCFAPSNQHEPSVDANTIAQHNEFLSQAIKEFENRYIDLKKRCSPDTYGSVFAPYKYYEDACINETHYPDTLLIVHMETCVRDIAKYVSGMHEARRIASDLPCTMFPKLHEYATALADSIQRNVTKYLKDDPLKVIGDAQAIYEDSSTSLTFRQKSATAMRVALHAKEQLENDHDLRASLSKAHLLETSLEPLITAASFLIGAQAKLLRTANQKWANQILKKTPEDIDLLAEKTRKAVEENLGYRAAIELLATIDSTLLDVLLNMTAPLSEATQKKFAKTCASYYEEAIKVRKQLQTSIDGLNRIFSAQS